MSKHHSQEFLEIALEAVRYFPTPRRVDALESLTKAKHPELRAEALQLQRDLEQLRKQSAIDLKRR